MLLGKVVGTVVASRKEEELVGLRFLLVKGCDYDGKPTGAVVVAVDAVGAGVGEVVLYASGSSARQPKVTKERPLEQRGRIVAAVREATLKHVRERAQFAVDATGLGRVDDKIKKNTLCAVKTPGVEILRPVAWSGDHGLAITERAPFGVIGAVTP